MNRGEVVVAALTVTSNLVVKSVDRGQAPAMMSIFKHLVVAAHNGNSLKNENGETGVEIAYRMMSEGADVLDATIAFNNLP